MTYEPPPSRNPTGRSRTHRNHLMSRPKNWQGTRRRAEHIYPCWCGDSLVTRYRMQVECCVNYLTNLRPYLVNLDLSADALGPVYFHTLRRADGSEIGGDFAFYTATDDKDWLPAEEDASDLDEQREYWLDTWVLVRRQVRMLGPEPIEEDDDDDDEPGGDQGSV